MGFSGRGVRWEGKAPTVRNGPRIGEKKKHPKRVRHRWGKKRAGGRVQTETSEKKHKGDERERGNPGDRLVLSKNLKMDRTGKKKNRRGTGWR